MKTICAWCKKVLVEDETHNRAVSHGFCPECLRELATRGGVVSLRDFLDRMDFPVLVTDGSVAIQGANRMAEHAFGRAASELADSDVGFAIECRFAAASGRCGRMEHCGGCVLRRTLAATHADGQPRYGMYSENEVVTADGVMPRSFRFSTTQIGDAVVLAVEAIDEVPTAS